METKFKVGDIVYDSVFYPNQKGEVIKIDESSYPISVMFEEENTADVYYQDGRFNRYAQPTLSLTLYELSGFTQERPWQPKEGEWIAVKNKLHKTYFIGIFDKIKDGNYFIKQIEEVSFECAKPLNYFINDGI